MADIKHEIVDSCAVFTAVSDRAKLWMVEHYHESTHAFGMNNPIEVAGAARFRREAKAAGLEISN